MSNETLHNRLADALPGILIGMGIAFAWWIGIGYLLLISMYAAMFGATIAPALLLLSPPLSAVGIAVIFSSLKKHNVATGILLVSIGFSLCLTLPVGKAAINQVRAWYADTRH
jgi:Na+-transporting NADH:ubiquinone oxidoreductase subunit NqrB